MDNTNNGSSELIFGPMWSGKTTEMLRRANRHYIAGKRVIYIKHSIDNRYNTNHVTSHDKVTKEAHVVKNLMEIEESIINNADVICIDEGHFFGDIMQFCQKYTSRNKKIIISALNADYLRKPFKVISELVAFSDKITHLTAVCVNCGNDACFTKRSTSDKKQILVGDNTIYSAVCRKCY